MLGALACRRPSCCCPAAVEKVKAMVECVRPGVVVGWVQAPGECQAQVLSPVLRVGQVQRGPGEQKCQFFRRRQGKPGLFRLANEA